MKNFLILILISLCLFSCKDRNEDPNVLPEATQFGKNTAGALVDGKVWVASTDFINPPEGTFCEKINNTYSIHIFLKHQFNNTYLTLNSKIDNLVIGQEYILPQSSNTDVDSGIYSSSNFIYMTSAPNYTGKIKITGLDLQNQIVSGTFEFKAIDNNGNTINITDGRFDKKFD